MTKLKGLIKKNRFRVAAVMGVLFLVIGVSLLGYSISAIQEREQLLNCADLTPEEMWRYEGSLRWWRNAYVTLFLPLTAVFVALGVIGLVSQPLLTRLHHKSVLETFADNVKRASKENYERPKLE
jgi:hypothetical protein